MRVASCVFVLACAGAVTTVACQPMYRERAQKLKTPDQVARPIEEGSGSAAPPKAPKLDDNCGTDRKTRTFTGTAKDAAVEGSRKRVAASREEDGEKRARLAAEAVEDYRAVLAKDPYNQEATLGLAISYDMLRRKQCALNMLSRIATLAKSKQFEKSANQMADDVKNNPKWFEWYRSDAERAVGR